MAVASCIKRLQNTFRELQRDPVEGVLAEIPDESDFLTWTIWMEGPPDSAYAGGVFKLEMKFPPTFPMEPPELRFISEFWHPNVYKDGKVCISILHPPGEDAMSGERPEERWLPTHSVSSIMLSVISMLNDPNISSPANLDASLEWRDNRSKFNERCKQLAAKSLKEKPPHVVIPHPETDPVQKQKQLEKHRILNDDDFFMDSEEGYAYDDYIFYDDDEEPYESDTESERSAKKRSKGDKGKDKDDKSSAAATVADKKKQEKHKSDKKDKKKDDKKAKQDKAKEKDKDKDKDKTKKKDKQKEKSKDKEKLKETGKKDKEKLKTKDKSSKKDSKAKVK